MQGVGLCHLLFQIQAQPRPRGVGVGHTMTCHHNPFAPARRHVLEKPEQSREVILLFGNLLCAEGFSGGDRANPEVRGEDLLERLVCRMK